MLEIVKKSLNFIESLYFTISKEKIVRALIQRVSEANVKINNELISEIDRGLLILICAMTGDSNSDVEQMALKISKIRIFNDDKGKMNKSVLDIGGEALVVSQFTLAADTSRGNRPGFSYAAPPDEGRRLYEKFVEELIKVGVKSKKGRFGENMKVSLINDGPTTIWIDSKN